MRIITIICLLLVFNNGFAQNVDLDKFYFNSREIKFPKKIIAPEKRTYSIKIDNVASAEIVPTDIILNGFSKAENGTIRASTNFAFPMTFTPKQLVTTTDIIHNVPNYQYTTDAEGGGFVSVVCPEADYKSTEATGFRKTYGTKIYTSISEASIAFDNETSTRIADAKNGLKQNIVNKLNFMLNKQFGYPSANTQVRLWLIGDKDDPEYANFQSNYKILKEYFSKITLDSIPQSVITNLIPAIDYYKSLPKQYAGDTKKDKKIRFAAYQALMKIFYHLDDLTKAEEYANLLIANDYDKKEGKNLIEDIAEKKEAWQINNVTNSHYPVANEKGETFFYYDK